MTADSLSPAGGNGSKYARRSGKPLWQRHLPFYLLLLTGLVLLVGRYYWVGNSFRGALRSYLAASYFFLCFIPFSYFLLKEFFSTGYIPAVISGAIGIYFSLPDRLLGLEKWYGTGLVMLGADDSGPLAGKLNWVSQATIFNQNFPGDRLLFISLLFLGLFIIFAFPLAALGKFFGKVRFAVAIAWIILLTQTWLHLSMRSPYTYLSHFEQPSSNYFYMFYVFKNRTAAVNADYNWHQNMEQLFMGSHGHLPIMIGRTFPSYLVSQFSRFIHPFYVWLVFNICLWAAAVACFYYLGKELYGRKAGIYAAILLLSAQGMINYVAQPMFYIFVNSNLVFILTLYYRFFIKEEVTLNRAILFGVLLGLCSLCYELSPWYLTLFFFSLWRPKFRLLMVSLLTGMLIYQGYYQMCRHLPLLGKHDPYLGTYHSPWVLARQVFLEWKLGLLFHLVLKYCVAFPTLMYHAFSLTIIPALLGMFLLPKTQLKGRLPLFILLPGAIACGAMVVFGSDYYLEYPRLVYGNFSGIYLACAFFLSYLTARVQPKGFPALGSILAGLYLSANLVWMNFDVFGHPNIYFHWFYRIARWAHIHPLD